MSWQFNHLIGPQTSGNHNSTDTCSSNLAAISSDSHHNLANASNLTSSSDRVATESTCPKSSDSTASRPDPQETVEQIFHKLMQQQQQHQQQGKSDMLNADRNHLKSYMNSSGNIDASGVLAVSDMIDQRDVCRFDNQDQANKSQLSSSCSADEQTSKGYKSKSESSSKDLNSSSSPSSSLIIDHLLPSDQHQHQQQLPWSTYPMPIYSSFGVDLSYSSDGEGAIMNDHNSFNSSSVTSVHDESSKISLASVGMNSRESILTASFNQLNSDTDDVIFPRSANPFRGLAEGNHHRKDNLIDPVASYSNMLNCRENQHSRMNMMPIQQSVITTSQSDSSKPSTVLMSQASQFPTNNTIRQVSGFDQQQSTAELISPSQQANRRSTNLNQAAQYQHIVNPGTFAGSSSGRYHSLDNANSSSPTPGGYFSRPNYGNDKSAMSAIQHNMIGNINNTNNASGKRRSKLPFFTSGGLGGEGQQTFKVDMHRASVTNSDGSERFSRKVFVGGLPPDIDEEEIKASFRRFGSLIVDWPHKAESKSYFPPKGYAFLLFQEESSVQALIDSCLQEDDKLYLCVSSPTIKDKPVQIRPWKLSDADYVLDSTLALDPRKTVFVGGVPRPLKALELAYIMNNLYGGVCYAGIDTDPELKYPKGAGRVAFSNHQSYIAAISARFVHLHNSEIEKRVEVKPYVLDDQFCDECRGSRCDNKFAPFFCANINCLQYYCENCWTSIHSQPGREFHKPLVKEGADRPRAVPFRWC